LFSLYIGLQSAYKIDL